MARKPRIMYRHVKQKQIIMSIETFENNIVNVKNALKKASYKLPTHCMIDFAS